MTFLDNNLQNHLSQREQIFITQFPEYWIDNEPKGIGILKNNYITYANPAMKNYLGILNGESKCISPFAQYFASEVGQKIQNIIDQSNPNQNNATTILFTSNLNDSNKKLKLTISRIPFEENLIQITIEEQKIRNEFEEFTLDKQNKLENLFELLPIGISILNGEKQVIYQNPALEKILDLTKDDLKSGKYRNRSYLRADGSEMPLNEFPSMRSFQEKKPIYDVEIGIIKEQNNFVWTNVSAIPISFPDWKMILVTTDISNRKNLEMSLKRNEQLLTDTNDIAKVGGLEYNIDTKKVTWTPQVYRIHEVDFDFIPQLLYDTNFYPLEDRKKLEIAMKGLIQEGKSLNEQVQLTTARGNRRWVQIRGKLEIFNGKIRKVIGTIQDITELKELQEKLAQIQKFESLGIMSAGIAHEFNNLLCGIQGFSDILLDMENHPEQKEYLQNIKEISIRAGELVKKLMYYSRKGKNLMEAVCMNTLVQSTIDVLQKTKPENIQIKLNLHPKLESVDGDPTQLSQLLINVCLNSFEAMPNGGTLQINTSNIFLSEESAKLHNLDINQQYIQIMIQDNGIGMSDEVKRHIFDPFFTTKKNGFLKGNGLGLPIAYGIVRSHNGAIEIDSKQHIGTIFKIILPQGIKEFKRLEKIQSEQLQFEPQTILILEDDVYIQKMLQQMFQSMKFTVYTAFDGQEGLEIYEKHFHEINFVLLDMKMPRMDGKTAFLQMKKINSKIKALLMTGYSNNEEVQSILDLGVLGMIEKPFDKQKLLQKMHQILALSLNLST